MHLEGVGDDLVEHHAVAARQPHRRRGVEVPVDLDPRPGAVDARRRRGPGRHVARESPDGPRRAPHGHRDPGVHPVVGRVTDSCHRLDPAEHHRGERERVDPEVAQRAARERRVGEPARAVRPQPLAMVGQDRHHLAEQPSSDRLSDDVVVRQEAAPHRLHAEDPGRTDRGDELAGLLRVGGEGLLDEDVLAGPDRQQRVLEVLAVRGGDVDDVDVRVGDKILVGAVGTHRPVLAGVRTAVRLDEGLGTAQVSRTDGDDLLLGAPVLADLEGVDHLARDPPGTEDAPAQAGDGRGIGSRRRTQLHLRDVGGRSGHRDHGSAR